MMNQSNVNNLQKTKVSEIIMAFKESKKSQKNKKK